MKTFSMSPGEEKKRLIECPVCGYPESSPRWSGSMGFVTCGRCGLVYQNPQPMLEDLAQRYDDEYFEYERENEENFFSLMLMGTPIQQSHVAHSTLCIPTQARGNEMKSHAVPL